MFGKKHIYSLLLLALFTVANTGWIQMNHHCNKMEQFAETTNCCDNQEDTCCEVSLEISQIEADFITQTTLELPDTPFNFTPITLSNKPLPSTIFNKKNNFKRLQPPISLPKYIAFQQFRC